MADLLEILDAARKSPPPVKTVRYFVRCSGCLAAATVDVADRSAFMGLFGFVYDGVGRAIPSGPECGACGGTFELMGPVTGDHWSKTEDRVPCDERCVYAIGPNCNCVCGGVNHGTNALVTVVIETGRAKITPVEVDEARARRWEFEALRHEAREAILARFGWVIAKKRDGWLPSDLYEKYRLAECAFSALAKAKKLRTHAGRVKALKRIAAEHAVAEGGA